MEASFYVETPSNATATENIAGQIAAVTSNGVLTVRKLLAAVCLVIDAALSRLCGRMPPAQVPYAAVALSRR